MEFTEFVQESVEEVFSTMLSMDVKVLETQEGDEMPPASNVGVVGTVGMAGKINGAIYMSYSNSLACKIVENMMGEPPSSVEEPDVADVIGELANMVAGGMKRRTARNGYNGLLVPPVVMVGEGIKIEPNDAPIAVFRSFSVPECDEPLTVRFYAKLED